MKSLDPRVERLPDISPKNVGVASDIHEQFETFEVFVQPGPEKAFRHEGAVHAPNLEMAFVLAKEAFTRRFTCSSIFVVATNHVYASPFTEEKRNVYDLYEESEPVSTGIAFEIFHLKKRGKQHIHAGQVKSTTEEQAIGCGKFQLREETVLNIWVVRTSDIRFTKSEEMDFWNTLPEKKFRDAADYKGGDKLNDFLIRNNKS